MGPSSNYPLKRCTTATCHDQQDTPSLQHPSDTRLLQARCPRNRRESPFARSVALSPRKAHHLLSARRVRSVRLCPLGLALHLLLFQVRDALPMSPVDREVGAKCHSRGRRGQTRRQIWSRGGTRRRLRRCPAISEMEHLCRTCPQYPANIEERAKQEMGGRQGARTGEH